MFCNSSPRIDFSMLINASFNDKRKYINGILYFVLKRKLYSQASAVRATCRVARCGGSVRGRNSAGDHDATTQRDGRLLRRR